MSKSRVNRQGRKRRNHLWTINPRCYYCRVPTILPIAGVGDQPSFPTMATLEHLRSKLNPTKDDPKVHPQEERTVLACYECNQLNNLYEQGRIIFNPS